MLIEQLVCATMHEIRSTWSKSDSRHLGGNDMGNGFIGAEKRHEVDNADFLCATSFCAHLVCFESAHEC